MESVPGREELLLRLHPDDDVAVARRAIRAGSRMSWFGETIEARVAVPGGHKLALRRIGSGEAIRKYGQTIGFARCEIERGDWVHVHNVEARPFERRAVRGAEGEAGRRGGEEGVRTFLGYDRPGGRVGTRNYIGILTTVNCSATTARYIRERFSDESVRREYPGVDGVVAFTFKGGCGMQASEPRRVLQRLLAGMARHPNLGGVVVLGLGCEVNQLQILRQAHRLDGDPGGGAGPVFLEVQESGGLRKTVEAGVRAVAELLPRANACRRTAQPVGRLVLALNCGGSDAHSGITANPALGVASDRLVALGGTSVLAETPEIYGAEHLLTARAARPEVGEKLMGRIRWWEEHVRRFGAEIDNNPSPGNKEGGLTTIYEKSLGAVAKGGQAPLEAVYEYAEPIQARGFCFMDTPGFDPVSMTGLVAGGCTVGVFTTGRGSVYGCKPSPCIKVATHSGLYQWMEEDMDLNAGTILEGTESVQQVGGRIFEEILAVAGGKRTKSEAQGVGDEEFAPWLLGPTL